MDKLKVLMIDNQDSFTFNLVDALRVLGADIHVYQNYVDIDFVQEQINTGECDLILLSPGPGGPKDAGICLEIVRRFKGQCPIAGICLGHQVIIEALGGEVGQFTKVMHGKSSVVTHSGTGLFEGVSNPTKIARYHSLSAQVVPEPLIANAELEGVAMAIEAPELALYGLQFHPESILSPEGMTMLSNLLKLTEKFKAEVHVH